MKTIVLGCWSSIRSLLPARRVVSGVRTGIPRPRGRRAAAGWSAGKVTCVVLPGTAAVIAAPILVDRYAGQDFPAWSMFRQGDWSGLLLGTPGSQYTQSVVVQPQPPKKPVHVPEPSVLLLYGLAVVMVLWMRRKARNSA